MIDTPQFARSNKDKRIFFLDDVVNGLSTQSSPTGKQENDLCSSDNNSKNNSRTNSKNNSKNNLPQQQWTRRDLQLFCERYTQEFTQGTSVSLTYHPIYIIAKKKKV